MGNVVASGVTEEMLKSFLNEALRAVGLAGKDENLIVLCRRNTKFCFIEFRTAADCNKALNLNGIPYMGQALKISRPTKYAGPATAAVTWQQLTEGLGLAQQPTAPTTTTTASATTSVGVDGSGGGGVGGEGGSALTASAIVAAAGRTVTVVDPTTKPLREIYVGNTSPAVTNAALQEFIGGAMISLGMCKDPSDNPIHEVRVNGKFCFLEFKRLEDAANSLNFNGIPFMGTSLRLSRPSKYEGGVGINYFCWDEMLPRFLSGELKLLTAGPPSTIICLLNMVAAGSLTDEQAYQDVMDDTRDECSKFGTVVRIVVPRPHDFVSPVVASQACGRVFVEMSTMDEARAVLVALKGRSFDGRVVDCKFFPVDALPVAGIPNYTYENPNCVLTRDGCLSIERVNSSSATLRALLLGSQVATAGSPLLPLNPLAASLPKPAAALPASLDPALAAANALFQSFVTRPGK